MKVEHITLDKKDYRKMSYSKLRDIEFERIELELSNLSHPDKLLIMNSIKQIMREMDWF